MTTAADRLAAQACDLACRIRTDNPADIHDDLRNMNHEQLVALASVMAALIPDDKPLSELLGWIDRIWVGRPSDTQENLPKKGPSVYEPDQADIDRCITGAIPASQVGVAERREAVRTLHAHGLNDAQIGRRLQLPTNNVCKIRRRQGLPEVWSATCNGATAIQRQRHTAAREAG